MGDGHDAAEAVGGRAVVAGGTPSATVDQLGLIEDPVREEWVQAWAAAARGIPDATIDLGKLGRIFGEVMAGTIHRSRGLELVKQEAPGMALDTEFVTRSCEAVHQFITWTQLWPAQVLAILLASALDAQEVGMDDARRRDAARAMIGAAIRAIDEAAYDVPAFRLALERAEDLVAAERSASTPSGNNNARISYALYLCALLRGAILGTSFGWGLARWREDGEWIGYLRAHDPTLTENTAVDRYRLDDAREQCLASLRELEEAATLDPTPARRAACAHNMVRVLTVLYNDDESTEETAGLLVKHARDSLSALQSDAREDPFAISHTKSMLIGFGELDPDLDADDVRRHDYFTQKLGSRGAAEHAYIRLNAVRRGWGAQSFAQQWDSVFRSRLDVDALEGEYRTGWLELLLHNLDGGRVEHAVADNGITLRCTRDSRATEYTRLRWDDDTLRRVFSPPVNQHETGRGKAHLAAHAASSVAGLELLDSLPATTDEIEHLTRTYCRAMLLADRANEVTAGILRESWPEPEFFTLVEAARTQRASRRVRAFVEVGRLRGQAVSEFLSAGSLDHTEIVLSGSLKLMHGMEPRVGTNFAISLAETTSSRLDASGDPILRARLSELARSSMRDGEPGEDLGYSWLKHPWTFKAPSLGDAILEPGPMLLDVRADEMLRKSEQLESAAAADAVTASFTGNLALDGELLRLSSYDDRETSAGTSAAEQLANVRAQFERHTDAAGGRTRPIAWRVESAQQFQRDATAVLNGRTVLLDISLGSRAGTPAIFSNAWRVSKSGVPSWARDISAIDVTARTITARDGIGTLRVPAFTEELAALRLRAQEHPGLRPAVSTRAEKLLSGVGRRLVGDRLRTLLAEALANGASHLAIAPIGPFTFVPFPLLLIDEGTMLGDDWTVSVIPSPRMLGATAERPSRSGAVAVASPYGGTVHGLDPRPELVAQAEAIAAITGGALLADGHASPNAVLDAAEQFRFLHIAAHGSDYAAAPSFQCLYLDSEGADANGRLFAFNVVQRDLTGLELVTLSACETALGRSDANSNLRGLTASFLKAGARAVVSALWQVRHEPSGLFFQSLYTGISRDMPPLEAFRHAQVTTRRAFPAARDWGAFAYFGNWTQPEEN